MQTHDKAFLAFVLAGALVSVGIIGFTMVGDDDSVDSGYLSSFDSYSGLRDFLNDRAAERNTWYSYSGGAELDWGTADRDSSAAHSGTNIQVQGVDEADIIKTDGQYIYLVTQDHVSIIKAYPPEQLSNVSFIYPEDLATDDIAADMISISEIYLLPGKLVVMSSVYNFQYWYDSVREPQGVVDDGGPWALVSVFDITNIDSPRRIQSDAITGYPISSRMVDDTVYLIAQQYIWTYYGGDDYAVPAARDGDQESLLAPEEILYDNETKEAESFINILALDVGSGESSHLSVIAGWASTVYMSPDALYITEQKWAGEIMSMDGQMVPEDDSGTRTTIYRIRTDGIAIDVAAKGEVKGWLLNQFSMDEKDSCLRMATTTDWIDMRNNVYILNETLAKIGALEDIAPGERIYSARFVEDTLYLVTFRQVDPLFVIDLSDPENPEIVGELVMPGFSSYLHPVDASHVLGIGSENGSVKVSLYDVSDPANPVETSKMLIEGNSWSTASYDHKAVLFDKEKELLVIPVYSYWFSEDYMDYHYTAGAYVFRVSISEGISLQGVVEHLTTDSWYSCEVRRSLYIGEYLYTVSYTKLVVSSLEDLSDINSLVFYSYPEYDYAVVR